MSVMTAGLKGLAGSGLRTALGKAAATSLSGAFWGAIVTLIVQSSSATTMTTIGLVSAGVLTFPQGLALVFGANVGTTGTELHRPICRLFSAPHGGRACMAYLRWSWSDW